ncbi:MAG: ABC transporter ATP-binding protein [Promethearchaeota archaeon]
MENITSENIKRIEDEEIVEESVFGEYQFDEMIEWLNQRNNFNIKCEITGVWTLTNEFFKGKGIILKKYDGTIFYNKLYILLEEGDLGTDNILIGRKIIEISRPIQIAPLKKLAIISKNIKKIVNRRRKMPADIELLKPNTYVLKNSFKKDMQNKVFFRAEIDYDKAIDWLNNFTQKYKVSCHIEGILISEEKQVQCIVTGIVKNVTDKDIFIQIEDAFDPSDPLNDETKEWLTKDWTIQVSRTGLNKIHPEYMLFEIGEELSLTKKVLTVENVKVTLGGRVIVHDVNFEIEKGEILGIIGESGAGKSTTLKAILGEFEYEGQIRVFGIDAHNTKAIAPFIGYVPQDLSRMYGNFNALENIVAFGRQYGIPDDILIQRGKKILKDLGIDHIANQRVDSISGGQKRRVSIAISIVHNPYLIFLDEPTSGLDPLARYELWSYLDIINKEYGITLCVISHYLDEIEYCDKAAIFLRGIGFYDYNSPLGLKEKLPGQGLALEVTLQKVTVEAVDELSKIPGVDFVIQRGERIRLLSNIPSNELAKMVIKRLTQAKIPIHSIELKVSVDMIDYFTVVSTIHQTQNFNPETGEYIEIDQNDSIVKPKAARTKNEDFEITEVLRRGPKMVKIGENSDFDITDSFPLNRTPFNSEDNIRDNNAELLEGSSESIIKETSKKSTGKKTSKKSTGKKTSKKSMGKKTSKKSTDKKTSKKSTGKKTSKKSTGKKTSKKTAGKKSNKKAPK